MKKQPPTGEGAKQLSGKKELARQRARQRYTRYRKQVVTGIAIMFVGVLCLLISGFLSKEQPAWWPAVAIVGFVCCFSGVLVVLRAPAIVKGR